LGYKKASIKENYDVIIIPGGASGAETLSGSKTVQKLIKNYHEKGKLVGMICAGTVL